VARTFDWSRFRLGIHVRKTPPQVFRLLATAAGLAKWFPNEAVYRDRAGRTRRPTELAKSGDAYFKRFVYAGGVQGDGVVLSARRERLFKISFGENGEVCFRLKPKDRGTLVELIQDRIPTHPEARIESHLGCRTGWTFFLTNLKSVAEGGPDLRETDSKRARDTALVNM